MLPQAPLQRPPAGRMRRQGRACLPRRQRPRTAAEIVPAWRGHAPSLDVSGHSRSAPASRRFRTQGCLMVGQDAGVELFRTADPPAAVAQLVQACQFPCGRAWAAVSDSPAPPPELAIGGTGDRAAPTDSASRLAPAPQPARRPGGRAVPCPRACRERQQSPGQRARPQLSAEGVERNQEQNGSCRSPRGAGNTAASPSPDSAAAMEPLEYLAATPMRGSRSQLTPRADSLPQPVCRGLPIAVDLVVEALPSWCRLPSETAERTHNQAELRTNQAKGGCQPGSGKQRMRRHLHGPMAAQQPRGPVHPWWLRGTHQSGHPCCGPVASRGSGSGHKPVPG
jgi:hypothetical protein